jgi:hypothetical protein
MKNVCALLIFTVACGSQPNSKEDNGWNENTLTKQKSECTHEFIKRAPNSKLDQVKGMCSCLIDEISSKYTYEESNEKASEIAKEMEDNGTIKRCLKDNGMVK